MTDFNSIINTLPGLTIYRNILKDPVVKAVIEHLHALTTRTGAIHPAHSYGGVYHLLAMTGNPCNGADAWQNHLLELILNDVNPFSQAAFAPGKNVNIFMPAIQWDLSILRNFV